MYENLFKPQPKLPEGSAFRRVRGWKPATPGLTPSSSREEALIKEASQVCFRWELANWGCEGRRDAGPDQLCIEATARECRAAPASSSATVQSRAWARSPLTYIYEVCTCSVSAPARRSPDEVHTVSSPPIATVRAAAGPGAHSDGFARIFIFLCANMTVCNHTPVTQHQNTLFRRSWLQRLDRDQP